MNKKPNTPPKPTPEEVKGRFWGFAIITVFLVPTLVLLMYEYLGGGLLSGIWGGSVQYIIHPDILVFFVYPALALVSYGFLCFQFKKYLEVSKRNYFKIVLASCAMVLATFVTAVIVFLDMILG